MKIKKYVPIGQAIFGESPANLIFLGIGSCVAVCLYDEVKKKGCGLHILLPHGNDIEKSYFFANTGIKKALEELLNLGIKRDRIWAKIAGGACVFDRFDEKSVGLRNIVAVKEWLNYYNIPLIAEDVGGRYGRNINFDLLNGNMEIKTLKKGIIVL